MKIFQIWYDDNSKSHTQYPFIPYDNTNPDKPNEFEYGVMRKLYHNPDTWVNNKKLGVVSWKFLQKTKISPDKFYTWVNKKKKADVHHINPFYTHSRYFENVWHQGQMCHPEIIGVAKYLFEKANLDLSLFTLKNENKHKCFCNYWVGNKKFWDIYMSYTEPLYEAVYDSNPEILELLFEKKADRHIESGLFSFIFERMFSTVLSKHDKELKIIPYYT